MNFSEEFFANRQHFLNTIAHLIQDEKERIMRQGLASKEDINKFVNDCIGELQTLANGGKEVTSEHLNDLHIKLKSIMLPGDFQKYSLPKTQTDEITTVASDEPVVQESQDEDKPLYNQIELAEKIINKLDSIAHMAGRKGDHETAYLIEQTARTIRVSAERGTLLDKDKVSDDIQERNQTLISEAHSLMDEFQSKFENSGYQSYVSAIRAEMRKLKEEDPAVAANSLRDKWK